MNEVTKQQEDPLGWIAAMPIGEELRPGRAHWLGWVGALGILIAFGHSILAMSGEETLAQVYREVKAPKLRNFKWAAFIVFVYSLMITGIISFFAVMIIPDDVRPNFQDNLISGLAMNVVGPHWAKLGLNALVVVVGFLILAGAVNTSIVGANGVLNRVTDDGVLPDWFQSPHKKFGTTWRLLTLIAGLQIATIVLCGGNVIVLGEAYAFGVVWSLVFKCLSMLLLRFTEPDRYRGYRVPLNIRLGRRKAPVGLALIFLVLLAAALANLLTKTVATVSGVAFTAIFLTAFAATERYRKRHMIEDGGERTYKHHEQFQGESPERLTPETLNLQRPNRKLVVVNSLDDLKMLETCLVETDPDTTEIVVLAAHPPAAAGVYGDPEQTEIVIVSGRTPSDPHPLLGLEDANLMTAVVNRAELVGKPLKPAIILTDEPQTAVVRAAQSLRVQELIFGHSGTEAARLQLDRLVDRYRQIGGGRPSPLTVRVIGTNLDERREIDGGSRIPCAAADDGETARSLAGSGTD